jgi:hypothetical protein
MNISFIMSVIERYNKYSARSKYFKPQDLVLGIQNLDAPLLRLLLLARRFPSKDGHHSSGFCRTEFNAIGRMWARRFVMAPSTSVQTISSLCFRGWKVKIFGQWSRILNRSYGGYRVDWVCTRVVAKWQLLNAQWVRLTCHSQLYFQQLIWHLSLGRSPRSCIPNGSEYKEYSPLLWPTRPPKGGIPIPSTFGSAFQRSVNPSIEANGDRSKLFNYNPYISRIFLSSDLVFVP